jgi:hypothetical protein
MAAFKDKGFTIRELESTLGIENTYVREAIRALQKAGYVQEKFTTNLIDPDAEKRIDYKITYSGTQYYFTLLSLEQNNKRYSDYEEEEKAKKRLNKRITIFCIIGFIIALLVVILFPILNS